LTSGYAPLGAVAMKPEIAHHFDDVVYEGGLTYNGHPISLAAAIANIQVLRDDHLIENSQAMGEVVQDLNAELYDRHPSIGETRNIGLFGIIELVRNRKTKEPLSPFNESSPVMVMFKKRLLEKGLFAYTHWHTLLIIPPLVISKEELADGYAIIDEALEIADREVK
jgi:taurine--2-oxoglutarate transaminase